MIGRHINNYEVTALLGEGGMGQVFLALHTFMGRKAAVKILHPDLARNEALVSRFFNEARAANAIRHPNIIDIIDVGMLPEDGTPFLLMEFLEGESLASRLARVGRLDVPAAVDIGCQAASALAAAHSKGIVHRDLKPDNMYLVPDPMLPRGERVKVLDFGIAKLRGEIRGNSEKTQSGTIMGTALYMSPEQCQGLVDNLDLRSDIYSLGIILHEMISGAPPFSAAGFADMIIAHVMKPPTSLQQVDPTVPAHVAAAVLRALAKQPDDRFANMDELHAALAQSTAHTSTMAVQETRLSSLVEQRHLTPVVGVAGVKETTLRAAAGQSVSLLPTATSPAKRKVWIGLGVGVAALGITAAVLLTRPAPATPASAPIEKNLPTPPPPPPPPAPAPQVVEVPTPAPVVEVKAPPSEAPSMEKPEGLAKQAGRTSHGRKSPASATTKPSVAPPAPRTPSVPTAPPPPPRHADPTIEKW